jgi:hypothetical protein
MNKVLPGILVRAALVVGLIITSWPALHFASVKLNGEHSGFTRRDREPS